MKNTINLIIFVAVLTGCSPELPSESDARKQLENFCIKNMLPAGTVEIDSFTKTKGRKEDALSGYGYYVDYKATLSYLKPYGNHLVGDKQAVKGHFLFQMTEKGWLPNNVDCPFLSQ